MVTAVRSDSFPNLFMVGGLGAEGFIAVGSFEGGSWASTDFAEASPSVRAAAVKVGSGKTSSPNSRVRLRAAFV